MSDISFSESHQPGAANTEIKVGNENFFLSTGKLEGNRKIKIVNDGTGKTEVFSANQNEMQRLAGQLDMKVSKNFKNKTITVHINEGGNRVIGAEITPGKGRWAKEIAKKVKAQLPEKVKVPASLGKKKSTTPPSTEAKKATLAQASSPQTERVSADLDQIIGNLAEKGQPDSDSMFDLLEFSAEHLSEVKANPELREKFNEHLGSMCKYKGTIDVLKLGGLAGVPRLDKDVLPEETGLREARDELRSFAMENWSQIARK